MKIAIDCRYLGMSGIGRVCEGIIENLDYSQNTFYLIGKLSKLQKYHDAVVLADDSNPFTKKGLLRFNKKRINHECDAIIIPNFIIPIGITVPVHIVMHDLIFLDVKETVKGKIDYFIKKFLLKRGMKKAQSVACVSEFTKSRCEYYYPKYAEKCYVNYNGLSKDIKDYKRTHMNAEKENTVVYVGNIKRHKGLHTLLRAFSTVKNSSLKLKIIGEREGFLTGLELNENDYANVEFMGRLDNEALFLQIQRAKFLVQPSVYEGFGLPPLEALYLGTQPILSGIAVFREIYSDFPVKYFTDEEDLAEKLSQEPEPIACSEKLEAMFHFQNFARKMMRIVQGNKS